MSKKVIHVMIDRRDTVYDIAVGSSMLQSSGAWAAKCLGSTSSKILVVSNKRVFSLYGDAAVKSFSSAGFLVRTHLIGDGERFKNIRTLETTLHELSSNEFSRADSIVALGGGVVGDLAGFAASIHLRGIKFLQIPTTLLAMIDSSVGGKTGVNTAYGKNLVGSFYQPHGVLVDIDALVTLPRREVTAGFCEAIKQAIISGGRLFETSADFLEEYPVPSFRKHFSAMSFQKRLTELLADQVAFKADIVQNDELESIKGASSRSRKILNFGHTFAHAIEKVTEYKHLRHGEAVGHGIRFAVELSKRLELIRQDEVDLLNDVVRRAGALPAISRIDPSEVLEAFRHDKKRIGDSLNWILLRGVGKPVIVPGREIPRSALLSTIKSIIKN